MVPMVSFLLNQIISANFAARELKTPFLILDGCTLENWEAMNGLAQEYGVTLGLYAAL